MPQIDLDNLLLALKTQSMRRIDVEYRVWSAIARVRSDRNNNIFGGALLSWRLATGVITLAASAGFMAAALSPADQTRPVQALESWTSPQGPLAPSVLLGG